jgi:hypothetical protein
MGAELIVSVLEFPKNKKEPNWLAAQRHYAKMTAKQKREAYLAAVGDRSDTPDDLDISIWLSDSLTEVKSGYHNHNTSGMTKLVGAKTILLIAADRTWGDSVPECDHIAIFAESGMAKAAGFLV